MVNWDRFRKLYGGICTVTILITTVVTSRAKWALKVPKRTVFPERERLRGQVAPHSLVSTDSGLDSGEYGHVHFPITLKREDTLEWLTTNLGELKIQQVLRNALSTKLIQSNIPVRKNVGKLYSTGTAIIIGAHECFYCAVFALHSYEVHAVEPLPLCTYGIKQSFLAYPQFVSERIFLYNNYVSDAHFSADTPPDVCSGRFHMNASHHSQKQPPVKVLSIKLDELLIADGDVDFLMIDTEGAELEVLASAMKLFRSRKVKHIFFEYTPMWYRERTRFSLEEAIELLEQIAKLQSYKCYLLRDFDNSIESTKEFNVRTQLSEDWDTMTTEGQSDILCTRCAHWLQINATRRGTPSTEVCDKFS